MSPLFRLAFAALALALLPVSAGQAQEAEKPAVPQVSTGTIVWWSDFAPAEAVGVRDIWVWLPPGYAHEPWRRYPVLYMHDGQNVFDRRLTNYDKEWGLDEAITRLAARGDLREWIVVAIRSPDDRYQALFPQKLYDLLPKSQQKRIDGTSLAGIEGGKPLSGDAYAAMVARDLKDRVDGEFRTLAGPGDTAVMGSSMGGLMSLYLIAEYPQIFGQAAGVSTHLPLSDPEGGDPEERAAEVAEAFRQYLSRSRIDPARNRIYFDHGTATLDAYYPLYFTAFDAMMADLGWTLPSYESRVFFGAEHEENAWAQRVDIPLSFLDASDP